MTYYCPKCNSVILSRRAGRCSFCQEPLPEKMMLTKEEVELLDKEEKEREEEREKEKKKRERERAIQEEKTGGDFNFPFFFE